MILFANILFPIDFLRERGTKTKGTYNQYTRCGCNQESNCSYDQLPRIRLCLHYEGYIHTFSILQYKVSVSNNQLKHALTSESTLQNPTFAA